MVQLRYFAISPPALIAVPGFEQIRVRELLETTCCVESRGKLVSDRLIMDKTVAVRRADGLFVELLGLENVAFDSRNFGPYQCGAILKVLRAVLCPLRKLFVVAG